MGPSIKLVAEFRRPWWEDRLGQVANFETDIYPFTMPFFSVFWDRPGPATLATFIRQANAEELTGNEGRIRTLFLGAMSEMFPEIDLESELVNVQVADWSSDPWAGGSASVPPAGAYHLRAELATPTPPVFWAGEATNTAGNAGAVHGALESGRRAAFEALHALGPIYITEPESRLDWSKYIVEGT